MPLTLLVALSLAAPVPKAKPKPALYFPTKVGTERVYAAANGERRDVVTAVERKGEAFVVSQADPADRDTLTRVVEVAPDSVRIFRWGPQQLLDDPMLVLKPAAQIGEVWRQTVGGGTVNRLAAAEEVTVPAGKFPTLRLDYGELVGERFVPNGSVWYAPGVGTVKQVHAGKDVLALKEFTPGKE